MDGRRKTFPFLGIYYYYCSYYFWRGSRSDVDGNVVVWESDEQTDPSFFFFSPWVALTSHEFGLFFGEEKVVGSDDVKLFSFFFPPSLLHLTLDTKKIRCHMSLSLFSTSPLSSRQSK